MPIPQALPQLADLIRRPAQDDALLRRVLNANYRLGDRGRADAIVRFAKNSEVPQSLRLEALQMLASWKQPGSRDRVLGAWRPIAERDPQQAVAALEKHLPGLLTGPPQVREQAIATAATLEIRQIAPKLHQLLEDKTQGDRLRADALGALESLGDQKLSESAQRAIRSRTPHLRNQGRAVLARLDPRLGVPLLEAAIESTNVIERQGALQTLGTLADPRADTLLLNALDRLTAGQVPLDSQLDVILAAKQRDNPIIGTRIKALEQDQNEPLHRFQLTLHGGSPERGREVFQRTNLSCQRCHQISKMTDVVGQGGRVGPDLSQSSSTWNKLDDPARRTHLLESIVAPSRTISKEFQSIVITTVAGKVLSGVQLQANATHIVVGTAQGQRLTVLRNDIDQISASQKSAMPDDLWQRLPPQDMRDLIAFLLTIR